MVEYQRITDEAREADKVEALLMQSREVSTN